MFNFKAEDGTGYMDATSYVSVEDGRVILLLHPSPLAAKFSVLEDDEIGKRFSYASKFLDNRAEWFGDKSSETQALRWPRKDVKGRDGYKIPRDTIPELIKEAVVEMAIALLAKDLTSDSSLDNIKELDVDGAVRIEFASSSTAGSIPVNVLHMLSSLGTFNVGGRQAVKIKRS